MVGIVVGEGEEADGAPAVIGRCLLTLVLEISVCVQVDIAAAVVAGVVVLAVVVVIAVSVLPQQALQALAVAAGVFRNAALLAGLEQIVQIAVVAAVSGDAVAQLRETVDQLVLDDAGTPVAAVEAAVGGVGAGKVVVPLLTAQTGAGEDQRPPIVHAPSLSERSGTGIGAPDGVDITILVVIVYCAAVIEQLEDDALLPVVHVHLTAVDQRVLRIGSGRVSDFYHELLAVVHGDGEGLFAAEGLQADQGPVAGFHGLGIDGRDVVFGQFGAVLALQTVGFLQGAHGGVFQHLAHPDQLRIAEFHALHVGYQLLRLLADLDVVQVQGLRLVRRSGVGFAGIGFAIGDFADLRFSGFGFAFLAGFGLGPGRLVLAALFDPGYFCVSIDVLPAFLSRGLVNDGFAYFRFSRRICGHVQGFQQGLEAYIATAGQGELIDLSVDLPFEVNGISHGVHGEELRVKSHLVGGSVSVLRLFNDFGVELVVHVDHHRLAGLGDIVGEDAHPHGGTRLQLLALGGDETDVHRLHAADLALNGFFHSGQGGRIGHRPQPHVSVFRQPVGGKLGFHPHAAQSGPVAQLRLAAAEQLAHRPFGLGEHPPDARQLLSFHGGRGLRLHGGHDHFLHVLGGVLRRGQGQRHQLVLQHVLQLAAFQRRAFFCVCGFFVGFGYAFRRGFFPDSGGCFVLVVLTGGFAAGAVAAGFLRLGLSVQLTAGTGVLVVRPGAVSGGSVIRSGGRIFRRILGRGLRILSRGLVFLLHRGSLGPGLGLGLGLILAEQGLQLAGGVRLLHRILSGGGSGLPLFGDALRLLHPAEAADTVIVQLIGIAYYLPAVFHDLDLFGRAVFSQHLGDDAHPIDLAGFVDEEYQIAGGGIVSPGFGVQLLFLQQGDPGGGDPAAGHGLGGDIRLLQAV